MSVRKSVITRTVSVMNLAMANETAQGIQRVRKWKRLEEKK